MSWYDWCCNNWGTKWDAVEGEGKPEDGEIYFLTAWAEPEGIIEKLFEKHPNSKIEWEYVGEGEEFKGKIYSDGKGKITREEYEYEEEESEE